MWLDSLSINDSLFSFIIIVFINYLIEGKIC